MSVVTVTALFATHEEAHRVGRQLVEERLAACVNILGPCRSIYRWQDAVEESAEVPAIFKTTAEAADALVAAIAKAHSYEVPAVVVWPIDRALPTYAEWVAESATGSKVP